MSYIDRFLIEQNYDRRSYIFDKDYTEQMDIRQLNRLKTPDQVAYEKSITKHSEVKKPWQEKDYQEMEYRVDVPKGGIKIPRPPLPIVPVPVPPEVPPSIIKAKLITNYTIYVESAVSWSTVHDAVTGDYLINSAAYYGGGFSVYIDPSWSIYRVFLSFDLSEFNAGNQINTAELITYSLYHEGYTSYFRLQQGTQSSPLIVEDFNAFIGTYFAKATYTQGYIKHIFNAAGIAYLEAQLSGEAKFCVRGLGDYLDIDPASEGNSGGIISGPKVADIEKRPYLLINFV